MAGQGRPVTMLTDFGTADGYVAAMRGVIASRCPHAVLHDITHEIPPGDIAAGAAALDRCWRLFPPGTIHLCVVDPGVGSTRRSIVVEADGRIGVAPDNGLLGPMLDDADGIREIRNAALFRETVAPTFQGRDIFAPVAAYLACGGRLDAVGPAADEPIRLAAPAVAVRDGEVVGVIVAIDRFGNLITNIEAGLAASGTVHVGSTAIGPVRTAYADVSHGDFVAVIGSTGFLEISVRDGSAAQRLSSKRGDDVRVRRS